MKNKILQLNPKRVYLLVESSIFGLVQQERMMVNSKDEAELTLCGEFKVVPIDKEETWYDSRSEFEHQVGDLFLNGHIKEVLTYDQYVAKLEKEKVSVSEMLEEVSERTGHRGFIRKVVDDLRRGRPFERWYISEVHHGVDVRDFTIATLTKADLN
jgi:hypothetical protein